MDYIIYLLITISVLVIVHEAGHFLAARLCRMKVDIFSIGFGKRLLGWNKINGFSFGNLPKDFSLNSCTDYRLCPILLGGYVKIVGMVDESLDAEFANKEPRPYEFREKPTYQKLFVISAGVLMNIILALMIFWGINFFQTKVILKSTKIGSIERNSLAYNAGFNSFDRILFVNGEKINSWDDVVNSIFYSNLNQDKKIIVLRNNEEISFVIKNEQLKKLLLNNPLSYPGEIKPKITEIIKNTPAAIAGLRENDILLTVNKVQVYNVDDVLTLISSHTGGEISLNILRENDTLSTSVLVKSEGKIGVVLTNIYTGQKEYISNDFLESLVLSIKQINQYASITYIILYDIITGKTEFHEAFGGPVKISKFAVQSADMGITSFLFFIALLSLSLAIFNILPFPVLDGGHLVIILIEAVIKREIPIKVKIAIQNVGFVLLLMLMAFIIYNDIISL